MCGILGSINVPVSSDLLNTIKHRGPDYQAIYCDECGGNKVYLAHTRLSIVDLSDAGNQPIESFDHNYVLVFNGEIYNHLDLRKEITNVQFKGHSDTETLLYYLIEKGENGICNLNGIFAFAFYDKLKGRIIVARDDFGVKPFYYYIKDNQFVFSSEIRPINKLFRSKIDLCSLRVLLSLRYVPSPYTLFENVQKLRPGHYGIIDLNARSVELKIFPFIKKIDSIFFKIIKLFLKIIDNQLIKISNLYHNILSTIGKKYYNKLAILRCNIYRLSRFNRKKILKQGYALIRKNGIILNRDSKLSKGDILEIEIFNRKIKVSVVSEGYF